MQLEKTKVKIRCEMGACKNPAAYTVRLSRVGIRSRIHICTECLAALGDLIANETRAGEKPVSPPKSIETLKPRKKGN